MTRATGGGSGEEGNENLDLTHDPPPVASLPEPSEKPWNQDEEQERVRGKIALYLLALLAGVVVASFVFMWVNPDRIDAMKTLLEIVFSPLIALVGAATGFYFGGKK
jgi:hypothetical protein